jgi:hypothetical protein
MEKFVYLVGTLHRFQGTYACFNRATKAQLEEFKVYLKSLISRHEICAIAEELSIEALQKYPHPDLPSGESVPFQVAKELGLAHKYCCPPDRATRDPTRALTKRHVRHARRQPKERSLLVGAARRT